jgi:hypothetical protein
MDPRLRENDAHETVVSTLNVLMVVPWLRSALYLSNAIDNRHDVAVVDTMTLIFSYNKIYLF